MTVGGDPTGRAGAGLGVRVPATSANLGPGFDALAVAVDVRMTVWTTDRAERRVLVEDAAVDELSSGDDNLVWRAFVAYCDWAGVRVPDVSLRTSSRIPLERGMGSSAAAAVAGVALARALTAGGGSDHDLIALVAGFEGHPDNAAAAMLGGVVLVVGSRSVRFPPAEFLRPVLCVPDTRLATTAARALLPEVVPHADAAANGARAALVLAGLIGAAAWDAQAMTDVLHEPARFGALPDSGRLVGDLRAHGIAACLSGAGPSVLAIVPAGDDDAVEAVRSAAGAGWRVTACGWDRAGAFVQSPAPAGR